jgi:hypothetical protein
VSKKTWGVSLTSLASQSAVCWQRTLPLGLLALPLAACLMLGGSARADQSILVRSTPAPAASTATVSEKSATTIVTVPSRVVPAAEQQVSTSFQAGSPSQAASRADGTIQLKWRARHPDSFALGNAKRDSAIRQASQLTELNNANPFNDPFEDRTRGQFTTSQQDAAQDGQDFDLQPAPIEPPARLSKDCPNCGDKCYNGRDCCAELGRCDTVRQAILNYDIKNITLDISPSFKPDAKTPEEVEAEKNKQLFQAKTRTWKDDRNNALVTGSLVDFSNDRVYVANDAGQIVKLPYAKLSEDDRCFVAAMWQIPAPCKLSKLSEQDQPTRYHQPLTMTWTASQVCHKPLYFEEIALERYGHTAGPLVQPWISGAHFFTNIAVLPYKMGINPLGECQYDLGYYRPGNCAPWLLNPLPLSPRGALFQAGAVTGVNYLIP